MIIINAADHPVSATSASHLDSIGRVMYTRTPTRAQVSVSQIVLDGVLE